MKEIIFKTIIAFNIIKESLLQRSFKNVSYKNNKENKIQVITTNQYDAMKY